MQSLHTPTNGWLTYQDANRTVSVPGPSDNTRDILYAAIAGAAIALAGALIGAHIQSGGSIHDDD